MSKGTGVAGQRGDRKRCGGGGVGRLERQFVSRALKEPLFLRRRLHDAVAAAADRDHRIPRPPPPARSLTRSGGET